MDCVEPKIDVRVAHEPGNRLGWDYNRILAESPWDWVLFVDHDVMLNTHPNWYHVLQESIRTQPDAGLLAPKLWHENIPYQCADNAPFGSRDTEVHRSFAQARWETYGYQLTQVHDRVCGACMLLNRTKALQVRFGDGQFEDTAFCRRFLKAGHTIWIVEGLYLFHDHDNSARRFTWVDGVWTATDKRNKRD